MAEREISIVIKGKNLSAAQFDEARRSIAGLKRDTEGTTPAATSMGSAFRTAAGYVGGFITAQAVIGGISSAFRFAKDAAIGMNATLEKSTLQFGTLMGDTQRAEKHVRDLFEFAKRTPFETGPIIEASRHMQTFGGDSLNTMDNLTLLGDAAAATGAPIDQLGFWVGRMYAAMNGGQPFGEATMRLMELGVLTPQVRSQMEGLSSTAGGGEKAFKLFQDSLGGFTGAMVAQASTWDGLMSSISDAINITLADALRPFFETVKSGAQVILAALGSDGAQRVFAQLKASLTSVFGGDGQGMVKSLGGALLTFGSGVLTVADLGVRAFEGIRFAMLDFMSFWPSLDAKVWGVIATMREFASTLPGATAGTKAAAQSARDHANAASGMAESLKQQALEARNSAAGNSAWSQTIAAGQTAIAGMRTELMNAASATNTSTTALGTHRGAQQQHVALTKDQEKALKDSKKAADDFAKSVQRLDTAEFFVQLKKPVAELSRELEELPSSSTIATNGLARFKDSVKETSLAAKSLGQTIREDLSGVLATIPGTLSRAFEGGGNVLGAVKSIGSQIGSTLGSTIGKTVSSLGSLGGPIGAAIGSLAGPLIGKIAGLFTNKNTQEVKAYNVEISKVRDGLLATYGPLDEIERKAQAVGLSFRDAWGHQGKAGLEAMQGLAQQFKQRWDALNTSLVTSRGELDTLIGKARELGYEFDAAGNFVGVRFDAVKTKANEFGVSVDGLGGKFRQLGIDEEARRIIDGFELMTKAGGDVGGVLVGMKDEIGKLVGQSIKFGTTIPANMRPWIQNLIETGQLIDADGQKITDMAAIKFGEPVKTEFETIASSIRDLIASIETLVARIGGIAAAASTIPQVPAPWAGWGDPPEMNWSGDGGGIDWGGPQAKGGDYRVTRPTLFLAGEAGPERVIFSPENRPRRVPGDSPAAPQPVVVNNYIVNDFTGSRTVTESEFDQIQARVYAGGIQVPARAITQRTR